MLSQGHRVDGQDSEGNTALHWAAWFRLDTLLSPLLERRARPDVGNDSGECPVHWAAKSSNVAALDAMTRANRALLSLRDCDGFTAFVLSAQTDNSPMMEWMYLKGVSMEEQDDYGRTALQWACYKGNKKTVQWLLSRSASIVHRDREGMTALHWAALKGHEQVADMLMDVGAVELLDVPDCAGETPIALAMRKRNRYLVGAFHKCQIFNVVLGRCFVAYNIIVFAFVLAPGVTEGRGRTEKPGWVCLWPALQVFSWCTSVRCCCHLLPMMLSPCPQPDLVLLMLVLRTFKGKMEKQVAFLWMVDQSGLAGRCGVSVLPSIACEMNAKRGNFVPSARFGQRNCGQKSGCCDDLVDADGIVLLLQIGDNLQVGWTLCLKQRESSLFAEFTGSHVVVTPLTSAKQATLNALHPVNADMQVHSADVVFCELSMDNSGWLVSISHLSSELVHKAGDGEEKYALINYGHDMLTGDGAVVPEGTTISDNFCEKHGSDWKKAQLDRATVTLHERERVTGESLGRARVEHLLAHGCGEYLTLVEKGDFKQACERRSYEKLQLLSPMFCGIIVTYQHLDTSWIKGFASQTLRPRITALSKALKTHHVLECCAMFLHGEVVLLYAFDTVFPEISRGWELGDDFAQQSALVARHTAYMIVNVTTYEAVSLTRPSHSGEYFVPQLLLQVLVSSNAADTNFHVMFWFCRDGRLSANFFLAQVEAKSCGGMNTSDVCADADSAFHRSKLRPPPLVTDFPKAEFDISTPRNSGAKSEASKHFIGTPTATGILNAFLDCDLDDAGDDDGPPLEPDYDAINEFLQGKQDGSSPSVSNASTRFDPENAGRSGALDVEEEYEDDFDPESDGEDL
ncbi:unnamed protein product [Symbiodinium natans]|uniref:Uncharacterized protein n=1 Tax=Symbiodinium natans TaxID=878477 RepID=A0A812LGK7_9DINO|nr:unnamed protein product [Symbiodinium natans]